MKRTRLLAFLWVAVMLFTTSCATSNNLPAKDQSISKPYANVPFLSEEMVKYHLSVRERIAEGWRIPASVSEKDLSTLVSIGIDKKGNVTKIEMDKSSGDKAYDESAIHAIRAAGQLPSIPHELKTETVVLGFNFRAGGAGRTNP